MDLIFSFNGLVNLRLKNCSLIAKEAMAIFSSDPVIIYGVVERYFHNTVGYII